MRRRLRRVRAGRSQPATSHTIDLSDEQGVRSAYAAYAGELYRFALRQLRDQGSAQDVVQEVFLRAWRTSDSYDAQLGSLRTWLFAIARNLVIDQVRRRAARPATPVAGERLVALGGADTGFDEAAMTSWVVEDALRRISPEHRTVLVETYLRGRPYVEVAAETGVPVGTLRTRAFYGLKALRLVLDEMGVQL
ncbi:MAG: sigma-70 family RNA polymerase sigma factor [Pseudonocardiaceae bacterium]